MANNPGSDYGGGLIFLVIFSMILASVISSIFGISFWLALGIVGVLWVVLVVIFPAWSSIAGAFARRKPCVHGVRRGKEGGCQACGLEQERREAALKADQAVQQRKKEINDKASELRGTELKMLRKRWLSRAELYFEMAPQQFENSVAELFRQLGYKVKQTPYSNDRGKDAIVWKDGRKYLIECKRYAPENSIGRRELQIFVAAMKEENAEAGFYVNTGRFASTAHEYAAQNQIELCDRASFPALVNRAFPVREEISTASVMCLECGAITSLPVEDVPTFGNCANGHQIVNDITKEHIGRSSFAPGTDCERCGSQMRLVHGWRGKFWGCSKYPHCRFTRRFSTTTGGR